MATINDNYLKLPGSYLFAEIARRVAAYKEANPDADIIRRRHAAFAAGLHRGHAQGGRRSGEG